MPACSTAGVDAGSFGYRRGAGQRRRAHRGPFDYFVTGSAQRQDGFRDHSNGHAERGSANFGYRFSPDAETRFYVNANTGAPAHSGRGDQVRRR